MQPNTFWNALGWCQMIMMVACRFGAMHMNTTDMGTTFTYVNMHAVDEYCFNCKLFEFQLL
jgi:hypothetical protein